VAFTSLLSNLHALATTFKWPWIAMLPQTATAIIQGLLPPILLSVILMLVPMIFRLLAKQQGVPTGNVREMTVQTW
jgi:calcium permeable stress-gated cation channel